MWATKFDVRFSFYSIEIFLVEDLSDLDISATILDNVGLGKLFLWLFLRYITMVEWSM